MKKVKQSLCLMLVFLMAICMIPTVASAAETKDSADGNWSIEADYYNKTCTLLAWKGDTDVLTIPAKVDGLTVTAVSTGTWTLGYFGYNKIANADKITAIQFEKNSKLTEIKSSSFVSLHNLKTASIPSSVKTLGDAIFADCTSLETFTMPSQITTVPRRMFYQCTALKNVKLGAKTTEIGSEAFSECTSLSAITLPSKLTAIRDRAFQNTALKSITVPNTVTFIGHSTFNNCAKLSKVTLSKNLERLDGACFNGCTSLKTITLPSKNLVLNGYGKFFAECPNLRTIYFQYAPKYLLCGIATPSANLTVYSPSSATNVKSACQDAGIAWKSIDPPTFTTKKRTTSKVTLKWKKVSGAVGYRVYRKVNNGSYQLVKTVTGTTFTQSGLKKGVTYRYVVKTVKKDALKNNLYSVNSAVYKTYLK